MLFSFLTIRSAKRLSLLTCVIAVCSVSQALATTIFQVSVDTSAINGTAGLIDFQFNPGTGLGTAEILSFTTTGGVLGGPLAPIGNVTGTLPGTVTIADTTGLNDYTEQITFGADFGFLLRLNGNLAGSGFFLSLYTPGFGAPLLTNAEFIGVVNVDGSGVVQTPITFPTATGGRPVATFTPVLGQIPEPSTLPLCAGAILFLCLIPKFRNSIRAARP